MLDSSYLAFRACTLHQLRANHARVPEVISGMGLRIECLGPGVQFWIFGPSRSNQYPFYWMHTNVIEEFEWQSESAQFSTQSGSIYRVDYSDDLRPEWMTPDIHFSMAFTVASARCHIEAEDRGIIISTNDIAISIDPFKDGFLFDSWPIGPRKK
jgi:hypothetical protein